MKKNYLKLLLEKYPNIASGRKNFDYFEMRIKTNILLTLLYQKKKRAKTK